MTVENLNITVKTNADKAAAKLLTLGEALKKVQGSAASVGGGAGARAAKGVEQVGKAAEKANKPLGKFLSSLKRIAFYRIIRGIIKSITQAFQEGLEKAYLFSQGINGEGNRFAAAMDRMKSAGNAMKGQLGSAFISLLAAVEPILITLINLVTKVADAISQFFAAFTGKTYLKANATAAQFADNMARGGAAAKEWKNQLLGFDEINRLNEPNQGGGGGGSNPLTGYSFEDTPISQGILDFVDTIKPQLEQIGKDVEGVVSAFSEWWNDPSIKTFVALLNEISRLITDVSKLVTGLAFDVILIPVADFVDKLGETFGMDLEVGKNMRQLKEDILGLMDAIQRFVDEPSWDNFAGIFEQIGDAVGTLRRMVGDIEFEALIKVGEAIDKIGELFGKEWRVAETIRELKAAFDEFDFGTWWDENIVPILNIDWGAIWDGIVRWFENLPYTIGYYTGYAIGKVVEWFKSLPSRIWEWLQAAADKFKRWKDDLVQWAKERLPELIDRIVEEIKGLPDKAKKWAEETVEGFKKGFKEKWDKMIENISEWVDGLVDGFKDALGIHSPSKVFSDIGDDVVQGLQDGISGAWGAFETWFSGIFGNLISWCQSAHAWLQDVLDGINLVGNRGGGVGGIFGRLFGGGGVSAFASGGFPTEGQLFLANEGSAPEMIGTMGGRTAVANNDQIVEGIRQGVYDAVVAAQGGDRDVQVRVYLDSREINAGQQRLNRAWGV
jgi:hypothetical protein